MRTKFNFGTGTPRHTRVAYPDTTHSRTNQVSSRGCTCVRSESATCARLLALVIPHRPTCMRAQWQKKARAIEHSDNDAPQSRQWSHRVCRAERGGSSVSGDLRTGQTALTTSMAMQGMCTVRECANTARICSAHAEVSGTA